MCTKEEVKIEVEAAERRMENRIDKSHYSTNQVISNFVADMRRRMDAQDVKLAEILMQTTKTNGRVLSIEEWKQDMSTWRDVHMEANKHLVSGLNDIKNILKWVGMLVGGAVILALVNLVLK